MQAPTDKYGRRFEKLRVSLTNACNFNCIYCVGHDHLSGKLNRPANELSLTKGKKLNATEYKACISAIHEVSPLKQVRFTGGEPMLNPHLMQLIQHCKELGIADVGLTTNAWYLAPKLNDLLAANIDSLNISLDGIDDDVINKMAGISKAHQVKETIIMACETGLPVKINAVIMKGKNEDQILPLLEFCRKHNIKLRYIEFMEMGDYHTTKHKYTVSQDEILNTIAQRYNFKKQDRTTNSTANYWTLDQGGTFGIIANHSAPFCKDCNRLRLDSTGKLYGCLSANEGLDMLQNMHSKELLYNTLKTTLSQKQEVAFTGSSISMKFIGG